MNRIMLRLGFGDCAALIYSKLFFVAESVSVDGLSQATGYSPTAVSVALGELERHGLVRRRKQGRKYVYIADENFIQRFEKTVEELLERELRPFRRELENNLTTIRDGARGRTQRLLESARDAERRLVSYIASRKRSSERRD